MRVRLRQSKSGARSRGVDERLVTSCPPGVTQSMLGGKVSSATVSSTTSARAADGPLGGAPPFAGAPAEKVATLLASTFAGVLIGAASTRGGPRIGR